MPKLIDHEERSTQITEAAWRVLVRSGAGAVSVRNVAQEAGLATGSLRRAFPTQASLLAACLELMGRRVQARIQALPRTGPPLEVALAALSETLPLDHTRRIEMEVYLSLGVAALSDPDLAQTFSRLDDGLQQLCGSIVKSLTRQGFSGQDRETAHLSALLDGLALHVLHGHDATLALTVLRTHLERLAAA